MNDLSKISASHLCRAAYIYLRQSTPAQVEHNRESTERQYALASKAAALGWPSQQVVVIDEDLGVSGTGVVERSGFARLITEVALGHVGIVLGLEVSRLARNNADWYRLLDLCGLTDTLIGDGDGIYHPSLFNDRLVLGLKGTMSEAESHVLRARLLGGIRNKAARGELRRGLPIGFVWGDEDGEVCFHPDESVCAAIRIVFARFAEFGSARRVWLWFRSERLTFPQQVTLGGAIRWVEQAAPNRRDHYPYTSFVAQAAPWRPSDPSTRQFRKTKASPSSYPFLADAGSCPGNCSGLEETTGAPSSFAVCDPRRLRASSRDGGDLMNRPPSPLSLLLSRHTRRRDFITALAGATAWMSAARAQEPRRVIGFLSSISAAELAPYSAAFFRGLQDSREGRNASIEYRFADGR